MVCGLLELRDIDREHSQGELSFWLPVGAWGRGYMSEVGQAVVQYGFEGLGLNGSSLQYVAKPGIWTRSGKEGFKQEGLLRQRVRKWGQFEDVSLWAILQQEWQMFQTAIREVQPTPKLRLINVYSE